ncbi:MAG: tetratricopeptide repeat protein, partial [Gemmatimonadota bacterium]
MALDRGNPGIAVSRLERARELTGDDVPALWYWGMMRALAAVGDLEAARSLGEEGVSRWPGQAVLLNNHAVLLEASGDLARTEQALNDALEADASLPQVSKNLGDVLYRLGRFDEAAAAFERAARLAPDLGADLYFKLGNLALRRGDAEAARTHWARTMELNPGHQLARANLQM